MPENAAGISGLGGATGADLVGETTPRCEPAAAGAFAGDLHVRTRFADVSDGGGSYIGLRLRSRPMRCPFAGEPDGDGVERPRYADVSDGGGSYMELRPGARPRRCLFDGASEGDVTEIPRFADASEDGGSYMERRPGARPRRCLFADVELEQARRQLARGATAAAARAE